LAWFRTPTKLSIFPTTPADVASTEPVMDLAKDSMLAVVWFVGAWGFDVPDDAGAGAGAWGGTPP